MYCYLLQYDLPVLSSIILVYHCEQGGAFSGTSITFLKPFINTNYSFTGVSVNNSANGAANTITNITKTGITYYTFGNSGGRWKAEGYI